MSTETTHKKVIVIGAGISGLCCTHRLMDTHGEDAILCLEASHRAGGYIQSENIDGYICDEGPNGFLDKEPLMLDWIDTLGISNELIRANQAAAKRFLLIKDRLVEIKPPPAFMLAPLLSIKGKLRLMLEPFIKQRTAPDPESIWDFAARRIGPEAADNLVSAMVLGVYGGNAKELSLAHCFPKMAQMEEDHGSLIKAMLAKKKEGKAQGGPSGPGGTLTTFKTGIGRLTQRAAQAIAPCLKLNTPIATINKNTAGHFHLTTPSGDTYTCEHLICALPAHTSVKLFQDFIPALAQSIKEVPSQPIAVICTGHDKDQFLSDTICVIDFKKEFPNGVQDTNGFGYLVPPNQNKDILGCIWTHSVFPQFAPKDKIYLRTMVGGAIHPEYVTQTDKQLLSYIKKDAFQYLGIWKEPEFSKIYRHPHGIPQYRLNHQDTLDALTHAEQSHPGLHFTGNSYHGISMNDCVKDAYRVTDF